MTEVPKVSPLAPAPSRGQARDDYSATADAFAASLPPMVDQINEVAEFVHEKAVAAAEAGSFAQAAQGYADDAQQSATAAEASSQSAIAAAAAAQASAGLPSLEGNDGKALVVSGGGVKWGDVSSLKRRHISAGYSLSADDKGSLISASGTLTQTFQPAATLGEGWFCYLQNEGNGDVTLDPDGAETIDGLSSYIMYPGEVRLVQCDGGTLRTVVLNSFCKVFESSGNFIKPPGYAAFEGLLWSAGASGFKGNNGSAGGGGGGGCIPIFKLSSSILSLEPVVIGSGGLGSAANVGGSSPGGSSSFAGCTVLGGSQSSGGGVLQGGTGSTSHAFRGANFSNEPGDSSYGGASGGGFQTAGGSSVYGGAGGGGTNGVTFGAGGSSIFGGRGGNAGMSAGLPGAAPGGGGGASFSQYGVPGDGARGELRIWGII